MALLAMLLAAAPTWPAPKSGPALVSSASGRCLDVKGEADTPGTALEIRDCGDQAGQAFQFSAAGELKTLNGTRCADAVDTRTTPGAPAVIRACDGRATQVWRQNTDGSVTATASGFCLDVSGAATANGTPVILWTCNGQSNQKWTTSTPPPAGGSGPCDLYAAGGTACVAAHSTVRALYGTYNGSLYQVRRASDNATRDIGVRAPGGFADAAAQDTFCAGTTCVITVVRDQSGRGNDLWYQGSAQVPGSSQSSPAKATSESLTAGGTKAYSLYINPGNSYWRDGHLTGVPTGAAPEGAYMVTSGTHVNAGCCFDYGNSETTRKADAAGAMDAINFGTECWFGGCAGSGPWVQADLEWGLYSGGSQSWNPGQRAFPNKFVTAMLKNNGTSRFALKGGNAQSGGLTTLWDGGLPGGYSPMKKQGAIVLGSGGDCCKPGGGANQSAGTFYEGAIVAGYPSEATDNAVQANITAAGYR
ncbi:arabinofuranosidase catalytic domain-containing protein [Streptomyces acidiscabies]|uniref:Arabinofuranosidase catalytic domain-containing protein n=1 Tax=Streptomyces acidiscabies TaxID=42234 RepID=A0AAP6BIT3_9ACTN|nr:arabinofuranosidase catalytic domain-containing protein [Streptomyces acidiscabies]MBP5935224.1 alpha-L-arabinofuranosidase [Streptomyces sp. LBUM 1476]MBZ3916947.1 ricin-type beta-trefoil lectin domain protein [Streptomyces acidiscabies]MDX2965520.1 arabinofuranosidase catalytic domain-containing protein [Streptomyces acidiscabies]MDX3024255.1 arabinofuranosidase catalytic domain-containing protein [Streptomyces acidiscabies]MDX3793062.1 arabinofuranosidase catalytic domain-containing prot